MRPGPPHPLIRSSFGSALSFTTKQTSCSSTDQGGGKRRTMCALAPAAWRYWPGSPAIHNQPPSRLPGQRGYCRRPAVEVQMAVQTRAAPFSVPSCSQCGTQMLIVRNSREWASYTLRTYTCPWCPHQVSEIVRVSHPPAVEIDQVCDDGVS